MRYIYWIHLRDSDGLASCVSSSNVSKTRLHRAIDFYSKHYLIEQILVQPIPFNIQNPPAEQKK